MTTKKSQLAANVANTALALAPINKDLKDALMSKEVRSLASALVMSKSKKKREKQKEKARIQGSVQNSSAPLAVGSNVHVVRPMSKAVSINGHAGIEVSGMEIFGDVIYQTGTASNTVQNFSYQWAPNQGLLELLDRLVSPYSRWMSKYFELVYVPRVSANTTGQIVLWGTSDPGILNIPSGLEMPQRFENNVLGNIWNKINLEVKTKDGELYTPTDDAQSNQSNIRNTYGARFGWSFKSETPGRSGTGEYALGTLYIKYGLVAFQQNNLTPSSSSTNFGASGVVPVGLPEPFIKNQIFLRSTNNPNRYRYVGGPRTYKVTFHAFYNDDIDVATAVPKIVDTQGVPINGTVDSIFSRTAGYFNDNVVCGTIIVQLQTGYIFELNPAPVTSPLHYNFDFDVYTPSFIDDF